MENLRIKIAVPDGEKTVKRQESTLKSLKAYDEYTSPVLRVLGVPYGGHLKGRDSDGEAFHEDTEIGMSVGDSIPVTYYHGFGPDAPDEQQEMPVLMGRAVYSGKDERGHWFDVRLDEEEPLALRVLEDVTTAKASSGAVSHLVRVQKSGLVDSWILGELALFETNDWKQPANQLAVVEYKTEPDAQPEAEAKTAETVRPAELAESEAQTNQTIKQEEIKMSENEKGLESEVVQPVENAQEAKFDALLAKFDTLSGRLDEVITAKSAPAVKRIPQLDKDAESDAFLYWLKTGDRNAYAKAALQEDTAAEGGYLVPNDFAGRIIAKRDEISIMRRMGAQVMQTSRDLMDVPNENAAVSPARVAEEGAYNESEPTFGLVQIRTHKVTDLVKISEELEEDEGANLSSFLMNHVARQFGLWENDAFFVGTGSNEPDGVFQSGTAAITSDFATTIAASEVPELFFKLAGEYRDSPQCAWAMNDSTAALIYGLTGDNFQFMPTPQGQLMLSLQGKPVYTSSKIAAHTAGLKSIVFGDFSYYMITERRALRVVRNPYLYQANGQVGLFWSQRVGGAVLQAEAFQYITAHA